MVSVNMAVRNLSSLSEAELEQTIKAYPWFAAAHRELFLRRVQGNKSQAEEAAAQAALFVPSRTTLYREAFCKEAEEESAAPQAAPARQPKPRYLMAGGDYFSRSDFEDLEKSGQSFSFNKIQLLKEEDEEPEEVQAKPVAEPAEEPKPAETCTETLARIYCLQGHFDRAIEVYNKLILLYPEKSAYFAALIDKIETKIKNI